MTNAVDSTLNIGYLQNRICRPSLKIGRRQGRMLVVPKQRP